MPADQDGGTSLPEELINQLACGATASLGLRRAQIIGAPEWRAIAERHEKTLQARAEASEILRNAQQRAESIMESARAQGYAEGLALARREHAKQVAAKGLEASQTWASHEERLCLMVTRTLQKLLVEPKLDQHFFEGVLGRVLTVARREPHLIVRVHPQQEESAENAVHELLREQGMPQFVEVVADTSLKLGGCVVESPHGVVDASLDTQLEVIYQVLLGAWRASDD